MTKAFTIMGPCEDTLRRLDLYIDNQLAEQDMADLLKHMEDCHSCYEELELRRRVRSRLRTAAGNSTPSPYLQARVLATVRSEAVRQARWWYGWQRQLTAAAAMFVVCLGAGSIAYQLGYLRWSTESRDNYIRAISQHVTSIMSVGLADHVHCTVYGKVPKKAPRVEEVVNDLPAGYKPMLDVVIPQIPRGYDLFTAHACRYRKRQFYHFAMKRGGQLVSLIITKRQPGEKFDAGDVVSSLSQAGLPVYTSGVQRFQIAAFETRDHLAWVVSDLNSRDNTSMMLALAPAITSYLHKLES